VHAQIDGFLSGRDKPEAIPIACVQEIRGTLLLGRIHSAHPELGLIAA
jgi:hypothetical protein